MTAGSPPPRPWRSNWQGSWDKVHALAADVADTILKRSSAGIRDTFLGLVPQVAAALSGLLTAILAARGLGAKQLGTYTLATSVTGIIAGLSDLGIGQTAVRFAAKAAGDGSSRAQHAILRWAFRLRLSLSIVLAAIFWMCADWIGVALWRSNDLGPLIRLATIPGVLAVIGATAGYYFQSENRFKASSTLATVQTLVVLLGVAVLAVLGQWSPAGLLWCTIISSALCAAIAVRILPREAIHQASEGWKPWARHLRAGDATIDAPRGFAAFMALAAAIVVVTGRLDVWLLGFLLPAQSVGVYSVATRFALPLLMFLGAVNAALWPRAARHQGEASIEFLKRTLVLSAAAAIPAVVYSFAAPMLISVVFGREYVAATPVAVLLCLRYALAIAITPIGIVGYSFGLVRWYWVSNLAQLVLVATLQVVLIERLGPMGAAVSLCANEVLGGAITLRLVLRAAARPSAALGAEPRA